MAPPSLANIFREIHDDMGTPIPQSSYGNATKHQVMDMTKRILHLESVPKPDDAADAVAIALCHARSSTSLLGRIQNAQGG